MADIISIPRQVLHQQVGSRLRQLIVEGRIAPGAKLNERALCEQLQISRTPLREAIKMLAAEGLVALLPNRGAVAAQLSAQDVEHTFEVIAGLEGSRVNWRHSASPSPSWPRFARCTSRCARPTRAVTCRPTTGSTR